MLSNFPNDLSPAAVLLLSEDLVECATCRAECDPEEEDMTELYGDPQCTDCRKLCAGNCGEFLTDDSIKGHGPLVRYRDVAYSGQLVSAHAMCAADTLLGYMIEDFSYDHTTREEIAVAFAPVEVGA